MSEEEIRCLVLDLIDEVEATARELESVWSGIGCRAQNIHVTNARDLVARAKRELGSGYSH